MDKWGDGKRFLFEDIMLYALMFLLAIAWDYVVNYLGGVGITIFPHETSHPIHFGKGQLVLALFSGVQLLRKLEAFRYYS